MEFFEVIKRRHSVRRFEKREIGEEKVRRLFEVVNSAPSAGDLQAYRVYVVRDEERKRKVGEAAFGQMFVSEAPIILVFFSDPERSGRKYGERGERVYSLQDATIAAAYAQLAATAMGLSTVWVGAFDEEGVRKVCGAPGSLRPVAIIPVGYGAETPSPTPRRRVEELFYDLSKEVI